MTGRAPAVSVVVPAYNAEAFLAEAIESVLAQTLADLELVIVDDGSTDRTAEIVAEYARRDRQVVFERQANQGQAAAANRGVALARAPLIARLDADDLAMPDRLKRQHDFFAANPAVGLLGGAVAFIDEEGRVFAQVRYPLADAEIRRRLESGNPFVQSAVMFRRSAFERVGGYRPGFDLAEDVDLWLRIAEHFELANLPHEVVAYRVHAGQSSERALELQAIHSLAAHVAARHRRAGRSDPFAGASQIDEAMLLANGATPEQIDAAVVNSALWLAKTMDRAGHTAPARRLVGIASDRALASRDRTLSAAVRRALAQRHDEQGRWVRARLESLRARLDERRHRRRP
ncbi:MAG TPA: glycosyltransferase [Solirubrobacterales bacterium]